MLMLKSQEKATDAIWLRLPGHRVAALKPEFREQAMELERAVQKGVAAYPDMTRPDFYDVELECGTAYIHVYRDMQAIYLVSHSFETVLLQCTKQSRHSNPNPPHGGEPPPNASPIRA